MQNAGKTTEITEEELMPFVIRGLFAKSRFLEVSLHRQLLYYITYSTQLSSPMVRPRRRFPR